MANPPTEVCLDEVMEAMQVGASPRSIVKADEAELRRRLRPDFDRQLAADPDAWARDRRVILRMARLVGVQAQAFADAVPLPAGPVAFGHLLLAFRVVKHECAAVPLPPGQQTPIDYGRYCADLTTPEIDPQLQHLLATLGTLQAPAGD